MNYKDKSIQFVEGRAFGEEEVEINEKSIPRIDGYDVSGGFILETGIDLVDRSPKTYMIFKLYMEEDNVREKD